MKKIAIAVILMGMSAMAMALPLTKNSLNSASGYLVNETGLTYDNTYDLDMAMYDANRLSAVVSYSSTTYAVGTFTDGTTSSGTIVIHSTTALNGTLLTLDHYTFTAGTDFAISGPTGPSTTATNLATAINAHYALGSLITASASGSTVTLVSQAIGGNFYCKTSALAWSCGPILPPNMTGGTGAYYSAASDTIQIASHGYDTGLAVTYSTGTNGSIGGLTHNTVYYVIPVDASTIRLATTSARAVLGLYINLTGQNSQATAHTFTLTPSGIGGTPVLTWQGSNDGSIFFDMTNPTGATVGSYTAPYQTQNWDFSDLNYRYLRLKVTAPTTGGLMLKGFMNVKK